MDSPRMLTYHDCEREDETAAKARAFSHFSSLFNCKTFSDLTIRCGDREWKAHKFMMCTRSHYFSKCCGDESFVEGQAGVVELKDDEPYAVNAMLRFIYTHSYADHRTEDDGGVGPAVYHAHVFAVAEKYMLRALMVGAAEEMGRALSLACPGGNGKGNEEDFADAIVFCYNSTSDAYGDLCPRIISVVVRHSQHLFSDAHRTYLAGVQRPFLQAMDLVPQLMKDLVGLLSFRSDDLELAFCYCCGTPVHAPGSEGTTLCPICDRFRTKSGAGGSQSEELG